MYKKNKTKQKQNYTQRAFKWIRKQHDQEASGRMKAVTEYRKWKRGHGMLLEDGK